MIKQLKKKTSYPIGSIMAVTNGKQNVVVDIR